jgi:hypothetical protein
MLHGYGLPGGKGLDPLLESSLDVNVHVHVDTFCSNHADLHSRSLTVDIALSRVINVYHQLFWRDLTPAVMSVWTCEAARHKNGGLLS